MASRSRAKANRRAILRAEQRKDQAQQRADEDLSLLNSPSFMQKLLWADHHIADLDAAISAWTKDGYRITEKIDDNGIVTQYAQAVRPSPGSVPLLIGDAAQCILSALDHLASAIAIKHPDGLTETDEANSQFPIRKSEGRNDRGVITPDRRVAKWPSCAQAVAQVMQPYLGSDGLDNHPIWLLRDLANRDKHRTVTVAAFTHVVHRMTMGSGFIDYLHVFGGEQVGTKLVPLIAFSRRNYGDIRLIQSLAVRFSKGPLVAGREVVPTLRELRKYVEDAPIRKLRKFA